MSKSSKFKNGISRRTLLKGATGALGLAAGSGAITGFPYVHSADPKVLRYLGTAVNEGDEISKKCLEDTGIKIEYITARREKLQPASNDDIYRKFVRPNRADKSHPGMHLPFPVGKKKEAISKDTQEEYESAQFAPVPVTPHSTHAGYLFFDMQGEPPEPGARLYISGIKAGTKELFYFELPLDQPATDIPVQK